MTLLKWLRLDPIGPNWCDHFHRWWFVSANSKLLAHISLRQRFEYARTYDCGRVFFIREFHIVNLLDGAAHQIARHFNNLFNWNWNWEIVELCLQPKLPFQLSFTWMSMRTSVVWPIRSATFPSLISLLESLNSPSMMWKFSAIVCASLSSAAHVPRSKISLYFCLRRKLSSRFCLSAISAEFLFANRWVFGCSDWTESRVISVLIFSCTTTQCKFGAFSFVDCGYVDAWHNDKWQTKKKIEFVCEPLWSWRLSRRACFTHLTVRMHRNTKARELHKNSRLFQ